MSVFDYDLCVIGGGINGAGIARDAAGRGLSVLLLEAKDLANATSSASTKLIHGGLRYLEFFEFRLVKDSLRERETLLGIAPHIIRPMEFILPHVSGLRPFWMIRLGLFLYDHLAKRRLLPGSYAVDLHNDWRGKPLVGTYEKGFCYSDCWVDDSRLVALNAMDAAAHGAKILTYHKCTNVKAHENGWKVDYADQKSDRKYSSKVRMVVNATGPWVNETAKQTVEHSPDPALPRIRLVKGSHIIINRAFEGEQAYILQQKDRRVIFAIPYERDYTVIGTTEEIFEGDAYDPRISDEELAYLCEAFSTHFKANIEREDVLWTYSGVRPLFDDGENDARAVTRDYVLHMHAGTGAPLLSVFGGKLTTYRILAEQTLNKLLRLERPPPSWTKDAPLPGGDFPAGDFIAFFESKCEEYPWLPNDMVYRYARAYGTRMDRFLAGASSLKDLGHDFGAGLTEAEISYLIRFEFVRAAEDILWRRSKIGMHMSDQEAANLEAAFPELLKKARSS
jgi:glycerol-3-phosphate dehydrogenase